MKLTIYTIVRGDPSQGLDMFLTPEDEQQAADKIMRDLGNKEVLRHLRAGGKPGAWLAFQSQMSDRGERWERHENDLDLLEVGQSALVDALRECITDRGALGYTRPGQYAQARLDAISALARGVLAEVFNKEIEADHGGDR